MLVQQIFKSLKLPFIEKHIWSRFTRVTKHKNVMIFHIHIDGHSMDPETRALIQAQGHTDTPFRVDMFTDETFAPEHHFTYKTEDSREFKRVFEETVDILRQSNFEGYLEGECVPIAREKIETPVTEDQIEISGNLEYSELEPGEFRESEIHIRFDHQKSDKRFVKVLRELGFMSVFVDKDFGLAEILTVQGTREAIKDLEVFVIDFLKKSSGVVNCTVKREDVAKYWLSHPNVRLAPIIRDASTLKLVN